MAVSKKKKIIIASILVLIISGIIVASVYARRSDAPEVQTAKVEKRNLLESKVTANGEVRPIQLINLTAEVSGRVTDVFVKEGDLVKKGQKIVRLDPTQQETSVSIQEAALRASQADVQNQNAAINVADNAINTARASLLSSQADLDRARVDQTNAEIELKRNTELLESAIVSRSVYDTAKARYDSATASVNAAKARVEQSQAQIKEAQLRVEQAKTSLLSSQARVAQQKANLRSSTDFLTKTVQFASIEGVIANKPIDVGTFATANFQSTPIVIIADMSTINVEVRVDETDIANVQVGQRVTVKVDALGDKELEGVVQERAASAVTKSGANIAATANTGTQEAKEFKVVVRLSNLSAENRERLRPGMSATATVFTDKRENVIAIPLQALVERDPAQLDKEGKAGDEAKPTPTPSPAPGAPVEKKKTVKGVFLVKDNKSVFTPVETGITGENDIEIKSGLSGGETLITGPYRQLRTLKNNTVIKLEDKNKKSNGSETKS
ncbi:MAG: efflux RND transporter periplasmic adaptor subunit [Blastocatellia bacterium]|nr:efflux RND transporter periplasmic adaptor subunit [Blastocatellia bacterium]